MRTYLIIYVLIAISSCSEKKTDTDSIDKGVYLDTIKKGDSVEIVPKVVEPRDSTDPT
jgi:hypothetical protein